MTAADSMFRKNGALSFPLSDTDETNLASLDPARDILLGLLAAMLNAELAPRWTDAAAGTPLAGTSPVTSRLTTVPDLATLKQVRKYFPLLAVSRTGDPQTVEEFTLQQEKITSRWSVDYILGPLEIGNELKVGDVLIAAAKAIVLTIREGGHRAYSTRSSGNITYAADVLGTGAGAAGFSTIRVVDFRSGPAAVSQGGPKYHALTMVLETVELSGIVEGGDGVPFDGASITLGTGNGSGTLDVVLMRTEVPESAE